MDDETRNRFDQLEERLDRLEKDLDIRFDRIDGQLRAVVTRLDGIETVADGLAAKIDRQAVMATTAMQAAEQALTSLTAVSRRVARLEEGRSDAAVRGGASVPIPCANAGNERTEQ